MRKIIMFTVPGCSACEEFRPRFTNVMALNSIPHEIVNLISATPELKQIATAFDIYAFPTTIIINEDKAEMVEGNVSEVHLVHAIKKCFG